ncbi:MAG TPA: hypothetical protein VFR97_04965 [Capillimicrobium sp.]|nr:hypothetical protein [Capillimicrobium sp.]
MEELATLLLLLIVGALVVNLVQGGPGQTLQWVKAKLFLEPAGA